MPLTTRTNRPVCWFRSVAVIAIAAVTIQFDLCTRFGYGYDLNYLAWGNWTPVGAQPRPAPVKLGDHLVGIYIAVLVNTADAVLFVSPIIYIFLRQASLNTTGASTSAILLMVQLFIFSLIDVLSWLSRLLSQGRESDLPEPTRYILLALEAVIGLFAARLFLQRPEQRVSRDMFVSSIVVYYISSRILLVLVTAPYYFP